MVVEIQLLHEPLEDRPLPACSDAGVGAWVEFRGTVRGWEDGRPIRALEYEAYEPMARSLLEQLAHELGRRHRCSHVLIWHRLGQVPVGQAALLARCGAVHRQEAFECLEQLLERLKRDVPIWKCRVVSAEEPAPPLAS